MNTNWRTVLVLVLVIGAQTGLVYGAPKVHTVSSLIASGEVKLATLLEGAEPVDALKSAEQYSVSVAALLVAPAVSVETFVATSDQVPGSLEIVSSKESPDPAAPLTPVEDLQEAAPNFDVIDEPAAPVQVLLATTEPVPVEVSDIALAPSERTAPKSLFLSQGEDGEITHSPRVLHWTSVGEVIDVNLDAVPATIPITIFVRDKETVDWNAESRELRAAAKGQTEIYIVSGKTMRIISATVKEDVGTPKLDVPLALTSLEGVFDEAASQAQFSNIPRATIPDQGVDSATEAALAKSIAATKLALLEQDSSTYEFALEQSELAYGSIALQFIDDRSVPESGVVYPLDGLEVWVVGTEFEDKTDTTGHVVVADVPVDSRLLIGYRDRLDRVRPGFVVANSNERDVRQVRTFRAFAFDTAAEMAGVVQTAGSASLCLAIRQNGAPVQGIAVGIDTTADGAFYFNELGYLDMGNGTTGADGRTCFYNIEPGPYAITLYDEDEPFLTVPLSAFPGFHNEETVDLSNEGHVNLRLAAVANAHEQLSSDPQIASALTAIDAIDIVPLGTGTPLMQHDFSWMKSANALYFHDSRIGVLSEAAEFESVLYSIDPDPEAQVLPLFPRGFIEDLSLYAQESFDPTLGVALIEHGALSGQGSDEVQIRLLDDQGREVRGGWYFADAPITKAMFFNLQPATYVVIAETGDGYWMATDILRVYSETASYVRLGSRTEVQLKP